jgi:hypothetical protein
VPGLLLSLAYARLLVQVVRLMVRFKLKVKI